MKSTRRMMGMSRVGKEEADAERKRRKKMRTRMRRSLGCGG